MSDANNGHALGRVVLRSSSNDHVFCGVSFRYASISLAEAVEVSSSAAVSPFASAPTPPPGLAGSKDDSQDEDDETDTSNGYEDFLTLLACFVVVLYATRLVLSELAYMNDIRLR